MPSIHKLLFWLLVLLAATRPAQASEIERESTARGPVIRFTQADYVFGLPQTIPASGWESGPARRGLGFEKMGATDSTKYLWVRMRFDRVALGQEPLSVYTENNHERLTLFLNGRPIYSNFTPGDTRALGWYRPDLIRLPAGALLPGSNELIARVESNYDLVSGTYEIGPTEHLQSHYSWQFFWRITGVQTANYIMLFLAASGLWMWLLRRSDVELLLVALLGFSWFVRNYNFAATEAPFGVIAFKQMTYYALYPAMSASLAFCVAFVRMPHWKYHARILVLAGFVLSLSRYLSVNTALTDIVGTDGIGNALTLVCLVYTGFLLLRNWWQTRGIGNLLMFACLIAIVASTVHDVGRLWDAKLWEGLGFYLQPYIGSLFCIALLISFGRRSALAFSSVETMNRDLAAKVEEARAELQLSEARRRELEVAQAIEHERTRIMREVHDGIGSNLVSALTIAERQNHPPNSLKTLRRALSDLKMTVDSLDPVGGDIVALVANFRHRVEPDLADAGITSRWRAGDCRPVLWLDAPNALHILRTLQEALSNVLAHAGASLVEIGCREDARDGRDGVLIWLGDDGCGIAPGPEKTGQGIASMKARASAIGGAFTLETAPGEGTKVALFLPFDRMGGVGKEQ